MAWSSQRKTGPNQKPSYTRKNSGELDPWCLTCGVNVRVDGVSYVTLSRHKTADLCDTFSRVLGAEFSESYASLNVCNRCERQLRRLGRYNSIILARNEGKKLRDQLERNLAKYGQTVVVSGDDFSTSPPKPTSSSNTSSSDLLKRSKSSELNPGRKKLGDFSNRPSSVNSEKFSSDADVRGLDHDGRAGAGFRKSFGDSSSVEFKKKSLIPHYIEEEKRWESRRRKWSKSPSTSDEIGLPSEKDNIEKKLLKKNTSPQHSRTVSFRDESLRNKSEANKSGETLVEEMESSDKTALIEAKEESDNNNQQEVSKKKIFNLKSSKEAEAKKTQSTEQSLESEMNDSTTNVNGRDDKDKEHWSGRINPFNAAATRNKTADSFESTHSFEDDVFIKDIIDLDEISGQHKDNGSTGHESVHTVDSEQIRSDLMSGLDGKNFRDFSRASSTSVDTSEAEVDPNDYNADNRSSLSEVEERINIKTQFKGAYYNIGSTEDLLQEFESELAADRARMHKLTPVTSIDKEDGNGPERLPKGGMESSVEIKKGKHDQDNAPLIDNDNKEDKENENNKPDLTDLEEPFFDDVDNVEDESFLLSDTVNTELGTSLDKQEVNNVGEEEKRELDGGLVDAKEENELSTVDNGVLTEIFNETPLNDEINKSEVIATDVKSDGKEIQDDYQSIPVEGAPITKKSEKSPLISADLKVKGGKEKFKDQEPGLLCCTIL